jgi:hypothetical protein
LAIDKLLKWRRGERGAAVPALVTVTACGEGKPTLDAGDAHRVAPAFCQMGNRAEPVYNRHGKRV